MLLNVILTQINNKGNETFKATNLNVETTNEVSSISSEIAHFVKETIKTVDKLKSLGINQNGIKKSQPLNITLQGLGDFEDVNIEFAIKNFGKWASDKTENEISEAISLTVNYMDEFNSWK
tara:strand:+ start:465 stop:827 length:363 start_codon:yes stop_codon:yes gene_type:complete